MECGSSLTACSAHGSTPGQFFCPGAKHSFCCKEHCCHLTSFDGRIIAQKSDFVNRHYRKREKKQEMGNGKLAQGCQSGVVGGADGRYFAKVTDDTFNWDSYQKNLAAVETFFAANDGKRCTALIVPSPAGVLRDSLPEDAPYYDEDRAFAMLEEQLGTAFADARQALAGVADPYYHTDHHWTTAGAQAAYHIWAEATGHTARSYEPVQATDRFRGTLYSKVLLPDSVYDEVDYCPDITIESADCDGTERDSLYDMAALEKKDKYELFLGGNYAKAVLRTGVENGKHLLLIKDSFANSLVPFLCGDYETITMVDLRYCREKIQPLADEADDVLVLYEITNFAADGNLFKLNLK